MVTEGLRDLVRPDPDPAFDAGGSHTVYPLVEDTGNRQLLTEWLQDHEQYEAVGADADPLDADLDLCVTDEAAFREHRAELEAIKSDTDPVLLPVLLLLPEHREAIVDLDRGDIADNVFPTTVDEIVTLPIKQTELEWRIQSLLRLRAQTVRAHTRAAELTLFKQAIDSSGHAVYITDTDRTIKYANPAFEEITGFQPEEAVGTTPRILESGRMEDDFFEEMWATLRSGEVWQGEIINQRKDDDLYTATQTIAPVANGGAPSAFVAVQTDITDRKQREDQLRRRTRAIDEAPVGVSISDPDREDNPLIYVNDAFLSMTGYPREEALDRNCRYLQGEETDPDRVARIRAAVDAQVPVSVTLRNYRKDGTEFWNHLEMAPVKNDAGEVLNWIGFQQNVTERKQRQQQLDVLERVLRHNLRNDMNVIRGRAETIASETTGEVSQSARQIVEMSDQLLGIAETEQEITDLLREEPTHEEITVADSLRRVVSRIGTEHSAATIEIDCPEDVTIQASRRIEEAIGELVHNAIVHSDPASPTVAIAVTQTDGATVIEIADEGPRIPEMERAIFFEDEERTPLYHGSGLGLWFVKLVAARSGGTLTIADRSPDGNVVGIELPR